MRRSTIATKPVIALLIVGFLLTSCSQKPSDSDVGRVSQPDGFKVKTFMIAKCTQLTPEVTSSLRTLMHRHRLEERETVSSFNERTVTYLSSDGSRMIRIYFMDNQPYKVFLEGTPAFIQPVADQYPDKFTVRTLINAKKLFTSDPIGTKAIVDRYAKDHDLKYKLGISGGETKRETAKRNEKRIVTKLTNDVVSVIVEGETEFVTGLRNELADHN